MGTELQTSVDTQAFLTTLERLATNKDVDVSKLSAIMDLQERMLGKRAEVEANDAFAIVCQNMPRIKKNGAIDFGKGQKTIPYAKWEDVQEIIRPIYEAQGFTLSFDTLPREGGGLIVEAILRHRNGHVRKSSFPVPLDSSGGKQNIQGMGSAGSYGIRYATRNLFNLVFEGEDDDGVKGAVVFVSAEQAAKLKGLLEETKTDTLAFLRMFECADVDSMNRTNFAPAINMLMTKKAKQTAKV